jgi:hypothetical protein
LYTVKVKSQTINAFKIQMQLIFTFNFKLEHTLAEKKVMYIYNRKYEQCHTDY